jgi:hypothetical protein
MRSIALPFVLSAVPLALAVACGGAAFDTASPPGGATGGSAGSPGGDGGSAGSAGSATGGRAGGGGPIGSGGSGGVISVDAGPPPRDAMPPSDVTQPPPDGSGCAALPTGAKDVYIDQRFTGTVSTGAAPCPFKTILEGLRAATTHPTVQIVHVAGTAAGLVYHEADSLAVGANVTLLGEGPLRTGILVQASSGGGAAVSLEAGAVLDGFSVTAPVGDAVLLANALPAPRVRNAMVSNAKATGIVALGPAEIGPNVTAATNGGNGIWAKGPGTLHIAYDPAQGTSSFDKNVLNGINLDGAALLAFDGGTANGNQGMGVRLAGSGAGTAGLAHVINGLTASYNANIGIMVSAGQSVKIRSSSLLGNAVYGLYYAYGSAGNLDIGLATDPGGNTFATVSVTTRNKLAGIYLCKPRGQGTQPAIADMWSVCPPSQVAFPGCDTIPPYYADVVYAPPNGDPLYDSACTAAP